MDRIIIDSLREWSNDELLEVWNALCFLNNETYYNIYPMEKFNEIYKNLSPLEVAEVVSLSDDFYHTDNFFSYDNNDSLISYNDVVYFPDFNYESIVEYLKKYGDSHLMGTIDKVNLTSEFVDKFFNQVDNLDDCKYKEYAETNESDIELRIRTVYLNDINLLTADWNQLIEDIITEEEKYFG